MKNSGTFIRSLIPADSNNIVTLIDFNQVLAPYQEFTIENIVEHSIILEDLQCKVGLFSLLEAGWPQVNALASESEVEAEQAKIKKEGQKIYLGIYHAYGNGPWVKKGEEILQNKNSLEQPWALMAPFFSTNETALLDEDLKIGVRVEAKAQGSGGLKGSDYLSIFGSWRKATNIRKKKDDGIEALNARIASLELAIEGRLVNLPANTLLGKGAASGTVEVIPRSTFATPAEVATAIANLVNTSPLALDTLNELAAALGNDANFSTRITNNLAAINLEIANINSIKSVSILTPLNIASNTWFTVGVINDVGFASKEAVYAISIYIQYGEGANTYGHWQYHGGGIISSIEWKAGGTQLATIINMEAHNNNDFTCSIRFNISSRNRAIQVMFSTSIITQSPSLLRVIIKRLI